MIEMPQNKYKVFGSKAKNISFLPTKFGTGEVINHTQWFKVANEDFEQANADGQLTGTDIRSVIYYLANALGYVYQQGVPEFNIYQDYPKGAVVTEQGIVYVSTVDIKGNPEPKPIRYDGCGNVCPNSCEDECGTSKYPSQSDKWCALVTKCEYDAKMTELDAKDRALETMVRELRGLEDVEFRTVNGKKHLVFELSTGERIEVPMEEFGLITKRSDGGLDIVNPDGTRTKLAFDSSSLDTDDDGKVRINPNYTNRVKEEAFTRAKNYTDQKDAENDRNLAEFKAQEAEWKAQKEREGYPVRTQLPIQGNGTTGNPIKLDGSQLLKSLKDSNRVLAVYDASGTNFKFYAFKEI